MKSLMELLMEHSYLRDQMKGLGHPVEVIEGSAPSGAGASVAAGEVVA
jgi:hypothetical protein